MIKRFLVVIALLTTLALAGISQGEQGRYLLIYTDKAHTTHYEWYNSWELALARLNRVQDKAVTQQIMYTLDIKLAREEGKWMIKP